MFRFLETDIREQKKYEKRIQTSVDNTVNDLRYEIKFENRVTKTKITFLLREALLFFLEQKYILVLMMFTFSVFDRKYLFGQIWSKKSKLSV